MIGSIIGDIVGSVYEFTYQNIKTKDFPLFSERGNYTDDSILTVATADWLLHGGNVAEYYSRYGAKYPFPMGGYGGNFQLWIARSSVRGDYSPYNSCGNGSAMRVGPVGWAFDTKEETLAAAKVSAECTHNHPEGIKGAQATALSIFMARKGFEKDEIRFEIEKQFGYNLNFTCDGIRDSYTWGGTCQDSVPQAIVAFLDGKDFEDCIRNAISIGGDSDTIGCITGSIAEAYYGIPEDISKKAMTYLPEEFKKMIQEFDSKIQTIKDRKEELISQCRYYNGEPDAPSTLPEGYELMWDYEMRWVKWSLRDDEMIRSFDGDIREFGVKSKKGDKTPLTLKALLCNRYFHWASGYRPIEDEMENFESWYENHYQMWQTNAEKNNIER